MSCPPSLSLPFPFRFIPKLVKTPSLLSRIYLARLAESAAIYVPEKNTHLGRISSSSHKYLPTASACLATVCPPLLPPEQSRRKIPRPFLSSQQPAPTYAARGLAPASQQPTSQKTENQKKKKKEMPGAGGRCTRTLQMQVQRGCICTCPGLGVGFSAESRFWWLVGWLVGFGPAPVCITNPPTQQGGGGRGS